MSNYDIFFLSSSINILIFSVDAPSCSSQPNCSPVSNWARGQLKIKSKRTKTSLPLVNAMWDLDKNWQAYLETLSNLFQCRHVWPNKNLLSNASKKSSDDVISYNTNFKLIAPIKNRTNKSLSETQATSSSHWTKETKRWNSKLFSVRFFICFQPSSVLRRTKILLAEAASSSQHLADRIMPSTFIPSQFRTGRRPQTRLKSLMVNQWISTVTSPHRLPPSSPFFCAIKPSFNLRDLRTHGTHLLCSSSTSPNETEHPTYTTMLFITILGETPDRELPSSSTELKFPPVCRYLCWI